MTSSSPSLLGRVAAGDPTAFEECINRYGGLVWSVARQFSLNHADAEDAVQDVFIELWRVAERYDASIASEPTFIMTIARRRLIDRRRRQGRCPASEPWVDQEHARLSRSPADWLQICDDAAEARRKMGELSSEQQRVLKLAIDDGLSQSEISERLDMPLGTVKAHARRGLIRLRELLATQAAGAITGGAR